MAGQSSPPETQASASRRRKGVGEIPQFDASELLRLARRGSLRPSLLGAYAASAKIELQVSPTPSVVDLSRRVSAVAISRPPETQPARVT
jgi:hypothetical protein